MGTRRFGVVGAGRHGSRYIRHILNDVKGAKLEAICRHDTGKDMGIEGIGPEVPVHGDLKKFLKEDLDIVVIAAPTVFHEAMATSSMEAGADVILEKPMAKDTGACRRLIDVEKSTGRTLMIGHTLRYCPVWNKMRELLPGMPFSEWFEIVQYLEPPRTPWLLDREIAGGGCVLNTGVHVFDTLRYVFDTEISSVECRLERSLNPVWEDFGYGTIKLNGGLEGSFKIARDSKYRSRTLRIDHENGVLHGDSLEVNLRKLEDGREISIPVGEGINTIVPLLRDMIECVDRGREPPITSGDGLKAVEAAEACYLSAEKGSEVFL